MWDMFIDWLLYRRTDWAMLVWLADASYVQDAYVRVCEVPWQMYRTHRCSVHVASMCPCMGTAQSDTWLRGCCHCHWFGWTTRRHGVMLALIILAPSCAKLSAEEVVLTPAQTLPTWKFGSRPLLVCILERSIARSCVIAPLQLSFLFSDGSSPWRINQIAFIVIMRWRSSPLTRSSKLFWEKAWVSYIIMPTTKRPRFNGSSAQKLPLGRTVLPTVGLEFSKNNSMGVQHSNCPLDERCYRT